MTVYYDANQIEPGHFPALLAIGDSWFWYPFASNLLAEVSAIVRPAYSDILTLGMVGATLESYAIGKFQKAFARELLPSNAQYYSAVLISGAGNDAVDWRLGLRNDCTGLAAAADCMDPLRLPQLLGELQGWMLALINEVHLAYDAAGLRRPDIFCHCYDYAPPNGQPARFPLLGFRLLGPWLAPAMDAANVRPDPVLRQDIVRILIGELQRTLFELDSPAHRVHVIESAGTLDPATDWANELHPNGAGFQKLVHGPWRKRLRAAGFAT
jgi:hypothetical protein